MLQIAGTDEAITPGEAYLADTPVLRGHSGTQPDLFLRWNTIPRSASRVDAIIHLHGFSEAGRAMPLAEKVPRSGLDLARRSRPSLALLPRGNWLRHRWYDFPALLAGGIDLLLDDALQRFGAAAGRALLPDRLVLTAHSGGGMPAVDAIAGARRQPDELHVFDGLYGRDPATGDPLRGIEIIDGWLERRLAAEPQRPGALRIVYLERQTGMFSRAVADAVARRLREVDPALRQSLARRYRVEPSGAPHAAIARHCGPILLGAADAVFDWTG